MKKIIIAALLLILANSTFCQQPNPSPTLTKQDILKKSKTQKTVAWVLMGVGVFSAGLGSVSTNPNGYWGDNSNSNSTIFLVAGLAAIGTSIPFFIASSKNRKKAATLSISNEKIKTIKEFGFTYRSSPSIALKIQL